MVSSQTDSHFRHNHEGNKGSRVVVGNSHTFDTHQGAHRHFKSSGRKFTNIDQCKVVARLRPNFMAAVFPLFSRAAAINFAETVPTLRTRKSLDATRKDFRCSFGDRFDLSWRSWQIDVSTARIEKFSRILVLLCSPANEGVWRCSRESLI